MDKTNHFRHYLTETDTFVVTCELIPGLVSTGEKIDDILTFAQKGSETGLVHAISLTDNPGGTPALSPDVIAAEIEAAGISAIAHVTSKDMNRNLFESRVRALDRAGVENVLIMSGDFPTDGQAGLSMPVFDLDPVHQTTILSLMNKGWRISSEGHELEETPHTGFFHGAVFSPCKCTEAEVMLQLYKLEMKARAGANYFITQMGFDAGKLGRILAYIRSRGINMPILGSVFILRKGAASAMHRGAIPGALVTGELLDSVKKESSAPDKGRAASLERAAKQVAILRGLGFRGAHIEAMVLKFDMVETILGRAEELKDKWEECAEEIAYAPKGVFSVGDTAADTSCSVMKYKLRRGMLMYRLMRIVHDIMFIKEGMRGWIMRAKCRLFDRVKPLGVLVHFWEKYTKSLLFDCRDCGDCALPELHYLCPQSQCPKQQRNGPCGGSMQDACEVYPDRPCVWTRIYTRAKSAGECDQLRDTIIGPRDWRLRETSGWVNYHLNRDHTGYDFTSFFDAPMRERDGK